jgi:dsRNA-specific ribonuclease
MSKLPPLSNLKISLPPLPSASPPSQTSQSHSSSSTPPLVSSIAKKEASIPKSQTLPLLKKVETKKEEKKELSKQTLPSLKKEEKKEEEALPPLTPSAKISVTSSVFVPKEKETVREDPRKHLETFFGLRNGVTPSPVEGKNYTLETLKYMTSFNRANEMTQIIVNEMKSMGKETFQIYDASAGIGGNTLSFADSQSISKVFAYEILADRKEMLKNNVDMYNFAEKVEVLDSPFQEISCGSVLFIDAPWLSSSETFNKEDYILQGMSLGGKRLEDWIKDCKQCALVAMKVPPGYQLEKIEGVETKEILLKNSLLILAMRKISDNLSRNRERYLEQKEREKQEYLKWRTELKEFLRTNILPLAITSPTAIDKLLSDETFHIWETTFTHESFSPTFGTNYEENELYGDAVFSACYIKYIMQAHPNFNRAQLSEAKMSFLSKGFQSKLGQSLRLGNFIRTKFPLSSHIFEDCTEALLGALEQVGDRVFKNGVGMGLAFNFVVSLYKDVEIDPDRIIANPKTLVKERMERIGMVNQKVGEKVPEESFIDEKAGKVVFRIKFPENKMYVLRNLGINVVSPIVGEAMDSTKKTASIAAYRIAISYLNSIGLTEEFVTALSKKREFESAEMKPHIEGIQARLKSECFVDFYFNEHHIKTASHNTNLRYIQLIGVQENGTKEVLVQNREPEENAQQIKIELLKRYKNYLN